MIMEKIEKINNFILKNMLFIILIIVFLYFISWITRPRPMFFRPFQDIRQESVIFHRPQPHLNNIPPKPLLKDEAGIAPRAMPHLNNVPPRVMPKHKPIIGPKMIMDFSLSIETKDINKTKNDILNRVEIDGGKVERFNTHNNFNNELIYNYTLKIPTEKVNETLNYFRSLGIVKNESYSENNSEKRYIDNENRLKNLHVRRDKLRKIMENKAEKLPDIMAVDRELNRVQDEIERLENDNKNIDDDVSYSRVELSILPETKIIDINNHKWNFNIAWKNAVNDSVMFTHRIIDFTFRVITFIPSILIILFMLFLIKLIAVKIVKKN